ncbi:MAG: PAS domain S-box protein, partial [Smithellaceae bacterium]|nr:PAS domain S-box protein [Smithellaceae bacterium]
MKRLGILLVIAYVAAIAVLYQLDIRTALEPLYLLPLTNTIFATLIPLLVAILTARAYRGIGLPSLLLTGCGMLAFGLCAAVAGWLIHARDGVNLNVTIYNTGALLGALFQIWGAALSSIQTKAKGGEGRTTVLAYGVIIAFTVLFTFAALQHEIPPFFIPGQGPTPLRQVVLGLAIIFYGLSAGFFLYSYQRLRTSFLYWYSLCLTMFALGLFAFFIQKIVGSPIGWVGRTANYWGSLFALAAVWSITRTRRTRGVAVEEILSSFFAEAEAGYRTLVETATDAIVSCDQQGRIILWNHSATKLFGYGQDEAIGASLLPLIFTADEAAALRGILTSASSVEIEAIRKDGVKVPVEISASVRQLSLGPISTYIMRDISARRAAERESRVQSEVLEAINRILRKSINCNTEQELGALCLDVVQEVTASKISFIGEVHPDGRFYDIAMSNPTWELCRMDDQEGHREPSGGFSIHGIYGPVLSEGESIIANDPSHHPDRIGIPEGHPPLNAFLGVPLIQDGRTVGMIAVGNRDGGYTLEQQRILEQLAPITIEALMRKRAEQASLLSETRFRILSETAGRLLATDNPQAVVDELCRNVMEHLNCDAFFNFLVDEKSGRLKLNACAGIPDAEIAALEWLDYGAAVCGCAAQEGRRIIAEDIPNTPDPRTDLVKSYGIKAYCCHPLFAAGRVIGTLSFGTKTRSHFAPDEIAVMRTVADQVAIAIERIQVREALTKSYDELQTIFDAVPALIFYKDRENRFMRINRAFSAATDMSPEELEGRSLFDLYPREEAQAYWQDDKTVFASGLPKTGIVEPLPTRKGLKWLQTDRIPYRDARGNIVGIIGFSLDITERKRMEEKLRESERRYRTLFANMTEGFALCEPILDEQGFPCDFRFLEVNDTWEKLVQLKREDVLGKPASETVPGIEKERIDIYGRTALTGKPIRFSHYNKRLGRYFDVFCFSPVPGRFALLFHDVTDQKKAEEALRESEEKLRTMTDNSPDAIFLKDRQSRMLMANPATLAIVGKPAAQVLGKTDEEFYDLAEVGRVIVENDRRIMEADRVEVIEETVRDDRGMRVYLSTKAPFHDAEGNVVGLVGVARDITENKLIAVQL